jgi:hypothetical protein
MPTLEEVFKQAGSKFPFQAGIKYKKGGEIEIHVFEYKTSAGYFVTAEDMCGPSDDSWELYTEPKKKKVLYQWLIKRNNEYFESDVFFESREDVEKYHRDIFVSWNVKTIPIKQLEHTRIEVDDE